jgi:hypothetical protein
MTQRSPLPLPFISSGRHWLPTALLCALAAPLQAATISLTGAGGNSGGYGNSLLFTTGSISVVATAWAETGTRSGSGWRLQTAEIHSWDPGIGICNRNEGLALSTCSDSEHELDTDGRDDLLVLFFNQRVHFDSVTVTPHDGPGSDPNDRDITYWVGDIALYPDLSGKTINTLDSIAAMGNGQLSAALSAYSPLTHALTGTGNALFLSGRYASRCTGRNVSGDGECEAYKIRDISVRAASVVPLPGALWLLSTALAISSLVSRLGRRAI